ncbi:hypothetical protein [Sulfurimonas sp.]|uniref:hypothetical protein n=1 Tax=Sulfurimonas sp. TaxID=2022749 RepID=UPI00356AC74E
MSKIYDISFKSEVKTDEKNYIYNGKIVKIITVFNDKNGSTALIEDENGEISEVPKDSII